MKHQSKQYSHLSRSILLEETGTSLILRSVIWGIVLITGLFIYWAMHMELEEVAIASGTIIPDIRIQKVQHLTGGQIFKVMVKEGEEVKKGQLLLKLDPVHIQSKLEESEHQLYSLLVRKERLEAFIADRQPDFTRLPAPAKQLSEEQNLILKSLINALALNKSLLNSQIKQFETELLELESKKETLTRQMALLDEELTIQKQLQEKGVVAKVRILRIQRDKSEIEEVLFPVPEKILKTREKINELRIRLTQLQVDAIKKARTELEDINQRIPQLREVIKRYSNEMKHLNIYATVDGIIHGLNAYSAEGIIAPGQTIMEIVPKNQILVAVIQVSSKDIGHVKCKQPVKIKLTTYDFGRYGSVSGELSDLSASTYMDRFGTPYYKGIVLLDQAYLKFAGKEYPIIPGMTLQADIKTGKKSLVEYLLKPIFTSANQALRER